MTDKRDLEHIDRLIHEAMADDRIVAARWLRERRKALEKKGGDK